MACPTSSRILNDALFSPLDNGMLLRVENVEHLFIENHDTAHAQASFDDFQTLVTALYVVFSRRSYVLLTKLYTRCRCNSLEMMLIGFIHAVLEPND